MEMKKLKQTVRQQKRLSGRTPQKPAAPKALRPKGAMASAFKVLTVIARHQFMRRGLRVYVCADFANNRLICLAQDCKYHETAEAAVNVIAESLTFLDTIDPDAAKFIRQQHYEIEYPTEYADSGA